MLFGGNVLHAALPVTSGVRVVFVASFAQSDEDQPRGSDTGSMEQFGDIIDMLG